MTPQSSGRLRSHIHIHGTKDFSTYDLLKLTTVLGGEGQYSDTSVANGETEMNYVVSQAPKPGRDDT